ncbi:MAG TPA: phenylalanine--tRNA ligase subunit alpha [Candidatus Paceibacterota bacterium]|nr:phenylalanine--tRNA ligase subunit alpha [Candidatus Paceibacterota bacterium]HRZ34373.1 phenylalanine--tRNA ligase subunit alpha [Candidatus Paceibacterota bacterium]
MNEEKGHVHIINQIADDIVKVFTDIGFEVVSSNEIEDEYHNFDALNVPKDHPARDMQDTFWLATNPASLLRTHTSCAQVRYMEKNKPPFKIVIPGKVYRYEATDRTHEAQFHQIEGLVVGENINMGHLKFALNNFLKKLFGENTEIRFRPGYFPFVEPGIEIDMRRKNGEWVEVLGAGMVHPNVLNNVGIDPKKYSGFAFGAGLDRLAMIKYGIDDIRGLYNGDLRLINQF